MASHAMPLLKNELSTMKNEIVLLISYELENLENLIKSAPFTVQDSNCFYWLCF